MQAGRLIALAEAMEGDFEWTLDMGLFDSSRPRCGCLLGACTEVFPDAWEMRRGYPVLRGREGVDPIDDAVEWFGLSAEAVGRLFWRGAMTRGEAAAVLREEVARCDGTK